jgi:hypothetical protein
VSSKNTIFFLTYLVLSGSTEAICKKWFFSDFFVKGNPISNHIQERLVWISIENKRTRTLKHNTVRSVLYHFIMIIKEDGDKICECDRMKDSILAKIS